MCSFLGALNYDYSSLLSMLMIVFHLRRCYIFSWGDVTQVDDENIALWKNYLVLVLKNIHVFDRSSICFSDNRAFIFLQKHYSRRLNFKRVKGK